MSGVVRRHLGGREEVKQNDSFQKQSVEGSSSLQYNAKMHICIWGWGGGRQGDKLIRKHTHQCHVYVCREME